MPMLVTGPLDMNRIVGTHDILLMTLDTLRHDVAVELLERGRTPHLAALLPPGGWQERHAPGNFTFASHQAMFAGFLPTPSRPGPHPRLFAAAFEGSETTTAGTCVFDAPTIVEGLASRGYHTICIGGTGFFNQRTPLGRVLPGLFAESHWSPELGVTDPRSMDHQVARAGASLDAMPADQRAFLFINVSAIHQPNRFYLPGAAEDSRDTHAAALHYVDGQIPRLLTALRRRGPWFCIVCSDHGTAYGEDGFVGHRAGHEVIWTVPYAHFVISQDAGT